ncbi:ArnT family glycosyltransferase [Aureliella helgolandensis]|uniref:Glycosyltransferase RgtA/B/C/D-like domain-containing protein n=1 Tax=Aureliella helgolandensis TaxID=2527968 RepID=A0A518GCF0_9BACT|nr:glycosyltransferase family 39 protein [Aureliella helgolandensis]QDV26227.1 hypothetical protein Q31a_45990 [Aureliella helgolandensis]
MPAKYLGCLVVILFGQGAFLWCATTRLSPTVDEYPHLAAGVEYWNTGTTDLYRVNPPLTRLWATWPVALGGYRVPQTDFFVASGKTARHEFRRGPMFAEAYGERAFQALVLARRMCIPLVLLGTLGVFALAVTATGNPQAACLASVLWGFNPIVLGYGPLLGTDIPAACVGVWAVFAVTHAYQSSRLRDVVLAAIWVGLAIATKFTWLILFPVAVVAIGMGVRRSALSEKLSTRRWLRPLGATCMFAFLVWAVVATAYRWQNLFIPLQDFEFTSQMLAGPIEGMSGNRWTGTLLGALPIPIPGTMLEGLDLQWQDFDTPRPAFLCGQWQRGGWYSYYAFVLLMKMPIGWLLLLAVAAKWSFRWNSLALACWGVIGICFVFVSLKTNMNQHGRYIWLVLPELAVVAVAGFNQWNRILRSLAWIAAGEVVLTSCLVFPFGLSFTNQLWGGPQAASSLLADSNVDWGQGWVEVARWSKLPNETHLPVAIVRPHWVNFAALGIDTIEHSDLSDKQLSELATNSTVLVLVSIDSRQMLQSNRTIPWMDVNPQVRIGCCVEGYEISLSSLQTLDIFWLRKPPL